MKNDGLAGFAGQRQGAVRHQDQRVRISNGACIQETRDLLRRCQRRGRRIRLAQEGQPLLNSASSNPRFYALIIDEIGVICPNGSARGTPSKTTCGVWNASQKEQENFNMPTYYNLQSYIVDKGGVPLVIDISNKSGNYTDAHK